MRASEIFGLNWADVMYGERLIAVRAKLKGGKMRYVPMIPELAAEFFRFPKSDDEDWICHQSPEQQVVASAWREASKIC